MKVVVFEDRVDGRMNEPDRVSDEHRSIVSKNDELVTRRSSRHT